MKRLIIFSLFILGIAYLSALVPVVSNINVHSSSGRIYISYDLESTDNYPCDVRIVVSKDGGLSYDVVPTAITGDIGELITPGAGKLIIWFPAGDGMSVGGVYKIRVIARRYTSNNPDIIQSMVFVEGGTFHNGVSDVTISSLFVDKYEVTQAEYEAVMGVNPSQNFGMGADYPVYYVTWFDAIAYSNLRSMQEGLIPCYSYDTYGTNPSLWPEGWNYRADNHLKVSCNWNASGYRLLTEMEWEFAARGGVPAQTAGTFNSIYAGSDLITDVAWYEDNAGEKLPGGQSHEDFGTHRAGTKTANELGIHDMSGNLFEMCWDVYGALPTTPQTDPKGAVSGMHRVARGGSWNDPAAHSRSTFRPDGLSIVSYPTIGFRVCRAPRIATPVMNPKGAHYAATQFVEITCTTPGAEIRYTTNGTEPTASSTLYSGTPIQAASNTTIKAKAFKTDWIDSNTATESYIIGTTPKVEKPFISPVSGTYSGGVTVTIFCNTPGAEIRFTTNGNEPTEASELYVSSINILATSSVQAKAFRAGWNTSETATALYVINTTGLKAPTPQIAPTPIEGLYTAPVAVTLSTSAPVGAIRYTTDGTDPVSSSPVYVKPISVYGTTTVKARTYIYGWQPSDVVSAAYQFGNTVADPVFTPVAGSYIGSQEIIITCPTDEVTIYYTTDGSEPTTESRIYENPITINQSTNFKAKAIREDWNDSRTVSANYSIVSNVLMPYFSPKPDPDDSWPYTFPVQVAIETDTESATIRYTLDGSEPDINSALYTRPITLFETTTIKAKAYRPGMGESQTATGTYYIILSGTPRLPRPYIEPPTGLYSEAVNVTISCDWEAATIRYTLDGEEPTSDSPVYVPGTTTITVDTNTAVKARAFCEGWADSEVSGNFYSFTGDTPGVNMVLVPGGTFIMGSEYDNDQFALPLRNITISPFYMSKYQVTQGQWKDTMGSLPIPWFHLGPYAYGNDRPVYSVGWLEAVAFCNKLSVLHGYTPVYSRGGSTNPDNWSGFRFFHPPTNVICDWTANGYRLPTEAEWEYAARGGENKEPEQHYSGSYTLGAIAWWDDVCGPYLPAGSPYGPQPVGSLAPNEFGIYDMSGNVWEWCWDWWDSRYHGNNLTDPKGPAKMSDSLAQDIKKVYRGGCWLSRPYECTVWFRGWPDNSIHFGLRVVRNAD